jgi:hypothetical protein
MFMRIIGKTSRITDRLWFDVYNPIELDDAGKKVSQGRVCASFELVPIEEAKTKENGLGRNAPNIHPYLEEPTGRLKFDLMNPL